MEKSLDITAFSLSLLIGNICTGSISVVGAFEGVVAILPVVICFQSLILDMAGNVGTQSLAVTIRVLMDENLSGADKLRLVAKEMKVGFCNGSLLGVMTFLVLASTSPSSRDTPWAPPS